MVTLYVLVVRPTLALLLAVVQSAWLALIVQKIKLALTKNVLIHALEHVVKMRDAMLEIIAQFVAVLQITLVIHL
jgi:hypothetical protein